MEVYSPKKFQSASFSSNTITERVKNEEVREQEIRNEPVKTRKEKEVVETEGMGEWMRRVFYERLKAFFEYEEVS